MNKNKKSSGKKLDKKLTLKIILITLGGLAILWPLLWAIFNKGMNPPDKYFVFTSLALGSLALGFSSINLKDIKTNLNGSVLSVLVMSIFWSVAGLFVYYIGSLMLYVQLMT